MKYVATAALLLAALQPFPAHADGAGYVGRCHLVTMDSQLLGSDEGWQGEVDMLVAASTPGSEITSARCTIKITESGSEQTVLAANTPLSAPVAAGVGEVGFWADLSQTVYLCTRVSVDNGPETDDCAALTTFGPCLVTCYDPDPDPFGTIDPIVCAVLVSLAPTVDSLPTAAVLYVEPDTGDLYVGGSAPEDLFWDCPPYVT